MTEMRSTLSRVRGLGSTNDGAHHWWTQRLTSVALVPLVLWFISSVVYLVGADYHAFKAWAGEFGNSLLLILLIITMFHHAEQGIQVVIEDYVHGEGAKLTGLIASRLVFFFSAVGSILAVLKLSFGG